MGTIFFLSAQPDLPSAPGPWLDTVLKKVGHALAFGLLAWLYLRALRRQWSPSTPPRLASLGLAVVYALSDEYHQTFVPGREGRLFDVAVDALGACAAMSLDWWLECRRALPRSPSAAQ